MHLLTSEVVWAAILPILLAGIGWLIQQQARSLRASRTAAWHAAAVRDQVQNTHSTNLRDDLDAKFDGLDTSVREIIRRLDVLTAAVQTEREDRQAGDQSTAAALDHIRAVIGRHHPS